MKRKNIPNKIRFEVFKRDSFTCQYCGEKSPDVVLQVDHIDPVSKGGTNNILNLITACFDCNSGKSNRKLSDNSVIEKQRSQLEQLQERKEQLEMLLHWQKGLLDLEDTATTEVTEIWYQLTYPIEYINYAGLKKLIKKYGVQEVIESMKIAAEQYLDIDDDLIIDNVWHAWGYVGKICNIRRQNNNKPYLRDILYIRGILRNRFEDCEERAALELLDKAANNGCEIDCLKSHSKRVKSWEEWKTDIDRFSSTESIESDNHIAQLQYAG